MNYASDSLLFQVWLPIALCAVTCALLHWLAIWGWGLHRLGWHAWSQVAWKKSDYIWLSLTALSIFSLSYQAHRFAAGNDWSLSFRRLESAQQELATAVGRFNTATCGWTPVCSENSPPNFDALEQQRLLACEHSKTLLGYLGSVFDRGRAKEFQAEFAVPNGLSRYWTNRFEWVGSAFKNLVASQQDEARFAAGRTKGEMENVLLVFAPFILAVGVAVRITRTTADVLHERTRAMNRVQT